MTIKKCFILFVFTSLAAINAFAQNGTPGTLYVDLSNPIRPVTHAASGALYGITENLPSDINGMVAPLSPRMYTQPARSGPGFQQPIGAAIPVSRRLVNTDAEVTIRLADILPFWPYQWAGWQYWQSEVSAVITEKRASGRNNYYGYELWNEPNATWNNGNGNFNSQLWKPTYDLVRSKDPGARIIGPSVSWYDRYYIENFLRYCRDNNCLPDVMGWHELEGSDNITANIQHYRDLERRLGISPRPISINEYSHRIREYEGAPGVSVPFVAKFERNEVESASISWWFTNLPGRLGSLLTANNQRGGGWWLYKWYGDMTGNMVNVVPPNQNGDGLDGFANIDAGAGYASIVLGGNYVGNANVVINNIPASFGNSVDITVDYVSWSSKDTPVAGTATAYRSTESVNNGSVTVPVNVTSPLWGYRVYVERSDGNNNSGSLPNGRYAIISRLSGKAIDIEGISTEDGANVFQWTYLGGGNQKFDVTDQGNGVYSILASHSGKSLDVFEFNMENGANIAQWSYWGGEPQQWRIESVGNGYYRIISVLSGKALDLYGFGQEDGTNIVQWDYLGGENQQWSFQPAN